MSRHAVVLGTSRNGLSYLHLSFILHQT